MPMLCPYFFFFCNLYYWAFCKKKNKESCLNRPKNKIPAKEQIFQSISTFLKLSWTLIILFGDMIMDHNFTIKLGILRKTIIINPINKQILIVFFVEKNIIM